MPSYFHPNSKEVVFETLEDEVIVIHMKSGNYFSLRAEACALWKWLDAHCAVEEIKRRFSAAFPGEDAKIAREVDRFIAELAGEKLITPENGRAPRRTASRSDPPLGRGKPFCAPVFEKFSDLQDFIKADPIHDVDDAGGWPRLKRDAA